MRGKDTTKGKSFTVFVCSTYGDLVEERNAVLEAIKKLQQKHDCMEYFGARSERPIEVCLKEVQQSDVLVVIVANRYGSLVPGQDISFSQAEYEEGNRLGKKCLVYMKDENIPVLPKFVESDSDKKELLEKFKETLRTEHTPAIFSDANDLAVSVAADVGGVVREPAEPDWSGLHNLPYERNPMFTGREVLLEKLHESLTASGSTALSQPPAISGLGGIGKTQIAIEYAYRHIDEYKLVLWVNADGTAAITSSYSEIARLLDLPEKGEKELNVVIGAVRSWLEANKEWLLIYDNADEPEIITEYQPRSHEGRILITSRATAFGKLATAVEVDEMAENDAVDFLLKRAKIKKPNDDHLKTAKEICHELGLLPLAIDHAGSFLEETRCSLSEYLKSFKEKGIEVLKDKRYSSKDYDYTVATTWSMSLEKLQEDCPAAVDIMSLCAFFAPDAIPIELISADADSFEDPLKSVVSDTYELSKALGDLQRYSLIKRKKGECEISIHRLLQAVIRHDIVESEARKWAKMAVDCLSNALPDVIDYRNWPVCERLIPHIRMIAQHVDSLDISNETVGLLFSQAGYYLYGRADYAWAEPFITRALETLEKVLGREHLDVAASLNNLAELYRVQGRYAEAKPLYRRALEIKEGALGLEDPDVALSLNNLAGLYRELGKYAEAEPLYQRALEINEKVFGREHPDVANSLNNLALLYHTVGNYAEAEPLYLRALEIREKVLDPVHPVVALSLNNLAGLYRDQGRYADVEPLFQRALEITERALGPEHPNVALGLNNLAAVYDDQGKYAEAEPLYHRALEIRENVHGPEHPSVAYSLHNLGILLHGQGREEEGIEMVRRAYRIFRDKLGPNHPNTKTVLGFLESWGVKPE